MNKRRKIYTSVKCGDRYTSPPPKRYGCNKANPLKEEKNKNKRLQYKILQNSICTNRGKKNHTIHANTQNATRD